jgi:DNA polymerase III epsilon subunit-like protein
MVFLSIFRMLARNGFPIEEKYDSLELAFFVLPTNATGHSTKALAEYYGLGEVPHRALADCEIEFEIITRLLKEFSSRPKAQVAALKWVAERGGWWWANALFGTVEFTWSDFHPRGGSCAISKARRGTDSTRPRRYKKVDVEKVKALLHADRRVLRR